MFLKSSWREFVNPIVTLLGHVHFSVGFGQQLFCVHSVVWKESRAEAQRQKILSADFTAGLLGQSVEEKRSFTY